MEQLFISILTKENKKDLIPFLQSLTNEQKKKLVPHVTTLSKEYLKYTPRTQGTTTTFEQKATEKQRMILLITSFVCFTRAQFEKTDFPSWILDEKYLSHVIDWYCPDWFSDFANSLAEKNIATHFLNYQWLMELNDKGVLRPGKALVTKVLPNYVYERKDNKPVFTPSKVLLHPLTLQEHIWYFFEEESTIHFEGRYINYPEKPTEEQSWIGIFKQYTAEGKIDRMRVLKEALLASNRNFNKSLSAWFCDLLTALKPSNEELIELQHELFTALNAPPGKPVNTALQFIKKIQADVSFDRNKFLDNVPVLLSSPVKITVTSTLMILDKLARSFPEIRGLVGNAVAQVFIHTDDELQLRAAKIILANKGSLDSSFADTISPFIPGIMISARKLLEEMLTFSSLHDALPSGEETVVEHPLAVIPAIETLDDLIFLASQAFDNNQSWHIDLLPAALVNLQHLYAGENGSKLEAALQRALKMTRNDMRSDHGNLDHMLAIFFIDVCIFLLRRYPEQNMPLQKVFDQFDQKDGDMIRRWMAQARDKSYLEDWSSYNKEAFYTPYKQVLLTALDKIKGGDKLPLLCTPTHEPGWVSLGVLAQRLSAYQNAGREPASMDLQIAIARSVPDDGEISGVSGELSNLLLFLSGKHSAPEAPLTYKEAWMVAALNRKEPAAFEKFPWWQQPVEYYLGDYEWRSVDEEYQQKEYNYRTRKNDEVTRRRKILRVAVPHTVSKETTGIKKLIINLFNKSKTENILPCLYDYLEIRAQYFVAEHNDARRILLLAPSNPAPFTGQVLNKCLQHPVMTSETEKRMATAVMQTLYEIWDGYGTVVHLFIGTCMLSSDKTLVAIAGETWLKAISEGKVNNALLGEMIGIHERIEFAPLKRFADLISQTLINNSPHHNKQLQLLIGYVLAELPDEPVKNLKKLLEIYAGLSISNKMPVEDVRVEKKLEAWKNVAALKKVIELMN